MELINREDIKYEIVYNGRAMVEAVEESVIKQLPTYEVIDTNRILDVVKVLNQRALETYKKAVKSRQTYDLLGDPMERDRALRYEGYADGFTRAAHYLEITFDVKLEDY